MGVLKRSAAPTARATWRGRHQVTPGVSTCPTWASLLQGCSASPCAHLMWWPPHNPPTHHTHLDRQVDQHNRGGRPTVGGRLPLKAMPDAVGCEGDGPGSLCGMGHHTCTCGGTDKGQGSSTYTHTFSRTPHHTAVARRQVNHARKPPGGGHASLCCRSLEGSASWTNAGGTKEWAGGAVGGTASGCQMAGQALGDAGCDRTWPWLAEG